MTKNVKETIEILYKLTKTYNPFKIAELLNIDIYYKQLNQSPLGHCSKILKEPVIVLDESLIDSELRYLICAHELCHAIKHTDIASYYSIGNLTKNKLELEADTFSVELIRNFFSHEEQNILITVEELERFDLDTFVSEFIY